MDRYFRIVDPTKVKGGSNACLDGVNANYDKWAKHNFLPPKRSHWLSYGGRLC